MTKGFKDSKGKFRPTEKKIGVSSSQVSQTSKEPNPDSKKADDLKNKKLTSKVEEVFEFGNQEETKYFKVKGVEARPEFDGKTVPVEFYVFSQNQFEATGDDKFEDMPFFAELVLTPKKLGKKKAEAVQDEVGDPETKFNITDVLLGGHFLDIEQASGKTEAEAVNKVTENVEALAGLIGFTLDRRINALGKTGWDVLAELALDKKFSFGSEL